MGATAHPALKEPHMTEFIIPSLLNLIDPLNIALMVIGLAGGIIIGALPGLSATMGVALMVPATFAMDPSSGLVMLGAIYVGAIYGGSNSAVLICTPGTPSAVATTFDGWPLTQRGEADTALYTSLLSSAFGGIVGVFFLLFLAGALARFALQFGGPENFWLCLFGLSTIAVMSPGNMLGTAYTVNLPASENLLLYYAVDNAQPGDVLVVSCAGYTERAVTGEIMPGFSCSFATSCDIRTRNSASVSAKAAATAVLSPTTLAGSGRPQ